MDEVRDDIAENHDSPGENNTAPAMLQSDVLSGEVGQQTERPLVKLLYGSEPFEWYKDSFPWENHVAMGRRLSETGLLYRDGDHGASLIMPSFTAPPKYITTAADLAPIIADHVPTRTVKCRKPAGNQISTAELNTMLRSEAFLGEFRPLDMVTTRAVYMPDWSLTHAGYNDGGPGNRIFFAGNPPTIKRTIEAISKFLDAMDFASEADRTNAAAFAITVLLKNFWPGAKPFVIVTATKSHAGKDTIIRFAAGQSLLTSIGYDAAGWAMENVIGKWLTNSPETAILSIENARLEGHTATIASACIERFVTSPELNLYSPGSRTASRRKNDIVIAMSTNFGAVSPDLANRSLHVHLAPTGNIEDRHPAIGNPKEQFLPENAAELESEFYGMVERWKREKRPLDTSVNHPFTAWAQTLGGIMSVSGFKGFLGNYKQRKALDDPARKGLGTLGAACLDQFMTPLQWAELAEQLGLVGDVIPPRCRENHEAMARGIGMVMKPRLGETFEGETDTHSITMRLDGGRRRWIKGEEGFTQYGFVTICRKEVPIEEDPPKENG